MNATKNAGQEMNKRQKRGVKWQEDGSDIVEPSRTPDISDLGDNDFGLK